MKKPLICLVTPALAAANNGNWQTAKRWARMLSSHYRVRLLHEWAAADSPPDEVLLLALHARRSAASVQAWKAAHPERPLVLALTGTDLYRDIHHDATARQSLELADALIVLQDQAPRELPAHLQAKCHVVFQSSTRRAALAKTTQHLNAVMVGHLRDEKSPETFMQAAQLRRDEVRLRFTHIGAPLDEALAAQARATAQANPRYRWLGGLAHEATRRHIQRAHVLVHASRMEGGAHVIMEAALCGTPVLASFIPGNVGMLGADYTGYFPWGDAPALAALLQRAATEPEFLAALQVQCAARSRWFEPAAEQAALRRVIDRALQQGLQQSTQQAAGQHHQPGR